MKAVCACTPYISVPLFEKIFSNFYIFLELESNLNAVSRFLHIQCHRSIHELNLSSQFYQSTNT